MRLILLYFDCTQRLGEERCNLWLNVAQNDTIKHDGQIVCRVDDVEICRDCVHAKLAQQRFELTYSFLYVRLF
jgi:hypothetical protein